MVEVTMSSVMNDSEASLRLASAPREAVSEHGYLGHEHGCRKEVEGRFFF
jgi:hypothetical protein